MSIHEPKPLSSTREKKRQDFSHQDKYNQFFRKLYPFPRKITNISLFCLAIISIFCKSAPYHHAGLLIVIPGLTGHLSKYVLGFGDSVAKAKEDFLGSIKESIEEQMSEGKKVPCFEDVTVEYRYDIPSFFDLFDYLNVREPSF